MTWRTQQVKSGIVDNNEVASLSQADLEKSFNDMETPERTVSTKVRLGLLEGTLGAYAVAGSAWIFVARVAYQGALTTSDKCACICVLMRAFNRLCLMATR